LRAALVSILSIGCEGGAPRLGVLPAGEPAEVEPGYANLPPLTKWRPPVILPRCGGIEPRTSTSPAIEILSSGDSGNVQIWEDGRVLFDGAGCPNGSRRRGKMSPARVHAVIDKLQAAYFFMWPCEDEVGCYDSYITSLTVQRGPARNTIVDTGCSSEKTLAAQAIELVMQAVGKNACSPP
jgi:hypothetical protein